MSIDKRRFPRIILGQLAQDLKTLSEAKVDKLSGQNMELDVYDLSYDSVAFSTPKGGSAVVGQKLKLGLQLSGFTTKEFSAEVARLGKNMVAVTLVQVDGVNRLALEGFLKDKMIGLNTYLVAPEFYSKKEGFSHWYHGPNTTNFILWRSGDRLSRAILEMGSKVLTFEQGDWSTSSVHRDPNTT